MTTSEQNYSALDGLALRRVSRMTPDGRWVWAWQSEWQLDEDAEAGRSIKIVEVLR